RQVAAVIGAGIGGVFGAHRGHRREPERDPQCDGRHAAPHQSSYSPLVLLSPVTSSDLGAISVGCVPSTNTSVSVASLAAPSRASSRVFWSIVASPTWGGRGTALAGGLRCFMMSM